MSEATQKEEKAPGTPDDHEPSMEEILASIRKIIAEGEDDAPNLYEKEAALAPSDLDLSVAQSPTLNEPSTLRIDSDVDDLGGSLDLRPQPESQDKGGNLDLRPQPEPSFDAELEIELENEPGLTTPSGYGEDVLELTNMVMDDGSVVNLAETGEVEVELDMAKEKEDLGLDVEISLEDMVSRVTGSDVDVSLGIGDNDSVGLDNELEGDSGAEVLMEGDPLASLSDSGLGGETAGEALVSGNAANATAAAFGQLAEAIVAQQLAMGGSDLTLADLVKELLRPPLKAWLDHNLEPIVREMIQAEISRMTEGLKKK